MKCPSCRTELSQMQVREIEVDVCRGGCGGIWFDHDEFTSFDEMSEAAPVDLLRAEKNSHVVIDRSRLRQCPRCVDAVLTSHYRKPQYLTEVDDCSKCNGVWLDLGELGFLRGDRHISEENQKVSDDFFKERLKHLAELPKRLMAFFGVMKNEDTV